MKQFGGDIPQEQRNLIKLLMEQEHHIDLDTDLPMMRKAQIYTCLARDWFDIDFQEEGAALLLKAEKTYPGYFETKLGEHMKESEDFKNLVLDMTARLLIDLNEVLKTAGKI